MSLRALSPKQFRAEQAVFAQGNREYDLDHMTTEPSTRTAGAVEQGEDDEET